MITNFKLFEGTYVMDVGEKTQHEKSELMVEVDLLNVNVYVSELYHLYLIITDRVDTAINFRNSTSYIFRIGEETNHIYLTGNASDDYNFLHMEKMNYTELYNEYPTKIKDVYNQIMTMDIENIANIQQYEGFSLLRDFLEQIPEINIIKSKNDFNL